MPELELYDHQQVLPLDPDRILAAATAALPMVMSRPGRHEAVLANLETVEVSFVDDAAIARVHGEFMDDPEPTDVITFDHGEILISTETAIRQGAEAGWEPVRECVLYLIHGLLHLNGHDDHSPEEFAEMKSAQEAILTAVWE